MKKKKNKQNLNNFHLLKKSLRNHKPKEQNNQGYLKEAQYKFSLHEKTMEKLHWFQEGLLWSVKTNLL